MSRKFTCFLAALLTLLLLAVPISTAAEAAPAGAYARNNAPNRLVVTFKDDPATTRAFNWYTSDRLESSLWISESEDMADAKEFPAMVTKVVNQYAARDEKGYFLFQKRDLETGKLLGYYTDEGKTPGQWEPESELDEEKEYFAIDLDDITEYSYKAEAEGLKPGTRYYYQVGSEAGGKSEIGTFVTAAGGDKAFSFLHYTDTQNPYWNMHLTDEAAYGADTLAHMLEANPDAEFVVHSGDIVQTGEVEDEWVDLFGKSEDSFMKTTLLPAAGNHDERDLLKENPAIYKFNEHFNVPAEGPIDGGSYYSITYNNVHIVTLNTNDNKNEDGREMSDAQLEWLRWDVKQARAQGAQWIILNFHKPLFSKSYHPLQDKDVNATREDFMRLIDELDVDLALQGHDHVLARTHALGFVPKDESPFCAKIVAKGEDEDGIETFHSPEGTIFIVPNTAGTKTYDDIYSKGAEHVHEVRPKLEWLTQDLIDEYNELFAFGGQPQDSPKFAESHSNNRDSQVQNFAKYKVDGNTLTVELYQIEGPLDGERNITLVDTFRIVKDAK